MPQGLQCWNAAGVKTLDTADRVGQMLGQVKLSGNYAGATISVPGFSYGDSWWIVLPAADATTKNATMQNYPTVTATGNSLTYTTGIPCTIVYGIY